MKSHRGVIGYSINYSMRFASLYHSEIAYIEMTQIDDIDVQHFMLHQINA